MKYPITPEYLSGLPDNADALYADLEEWVLEDICRRFRVSGEMTNSATEQIKLLKRQGLDQEAIDRHIQQTLGKSDAEIDKAWENAIERNQQYYGEMLTKAMLTEEVFSNPAMLEEIDAIMRQTKGDFKNLTQSMGFAVRGPDGKVAFSPIAETYQKVLDNAEMKVWSGATSYDEAIKDAVKQLTASGLQMVDYASGWHNRVDVAVRRAIMTGASQISAQYSERIGEELETPYFEVTAHSGARETAGPNPWSNHKAWQGKVYSKNRGDKYPCIYDVCGLDKADGLKGANCRHMYYPFTDGISERTYSDAELAHIDDKLDFTYEGRHYTAYEATQKQRQIERAIRKARRESVAFRAAGLEDDAVDSDVRARRLNEVYRDFSKAAGLRTQAERTRVYKKMLAISTKESKNTLKGVGLQYFAERDLKKQTSASIKKGLQTTRKRLDTHIDKVNHPEKYINGYETADPRYVSGTIKHWKHEIDVLEENIQNRIDELKLRGDYDGE